MGKSINPLPRSSLTWPRDDSLTDGEDSGAPAKATGRGGSTTSGRQFGEMRDGYFRVRRWALAAASRARSRETVLQMRRTESAGRRALLILQSCRRDLSRQYNPRDLVLLQPRSQALIVRPEPTIEV